MVAKPLPPKHTSMRQSMDGMAHLLPVSRCFFALHTALASSNFSAGQSLMFGRFATITGVLVRLLVHVDLHIHVITLRRFHPPINLNFQTLGTPILEFDVHNVERFA